MVISFVMSADLAVAIWTGVVYEVLSLILEDDISNVLDGGIEGCDVWEFG